MSYIINKKVNMADIKKEREHKVKIKMYVNVGVCPFKIPFEIYISFFLKISIGYLTFLMWYVCSLLFSRPE